MNGQQAPHKHDRTSPDSLVSDLISRTAAVTNRPPATAQASAAPPHAQAPASVPPAPEPAWTPRNTFKKRAVAVSLTAAALGALYFFANENPPSINSTPPVIPTPSAAHSPTSAPPREPIIERPPGIPPQILDRAELRYCYREGYRLDGMRDFVDAAKDNNLVNVFNARVNDFNARCGRMRFYVDDERSVKAEVDAQASFWRNNWRN